jgi:Zn-finger nucleic acid-binding protein
MCPKCGEPLIVLEFEGIEVDHCMSCGGTWLDAGELERITELAGAEPGSLSQALEKAKGEKGDRKCPRCRRRLRRISVGEPAAVEIDKCPKGDGLWFDKGEIYTVVKDFETGEGGLVARFFSEVFKSELQSQSRGE